MDYTSLTADKLTEGSIKAWANNANAPAVTILEEAQALIYQRLRTREMRTSATLSLALGDITEPLPSDFLDPIIMFDPYKCEVVYVGEDDIDGERVVNDDGSFGQDIPSKYAIYDECFQFDYAANAAMNLRLIYFKRPTLLNDTTNKTNFLTTRYPHLVRAACMVGVYDFFKRYDAKQASMQDLTALLGTIPADDDLVRRGQENLADYTPYGR